MNTTVKIDGSPALFCYSKFPGYPDNSICLKSFVANANNVLSSEEEIEERYGDRAEMAEKLKFGLELAKYIPEGECWQGDCLFTQRDLKEQEIEGTKYITFHPNKIVYAFSEENEGYEKVRDAAFGIAFHTIYKAGKDGGKTQSFRVDPERLEGVPDYFYIMSPAINSAKSNSKFDIEAINNKYDDLKKAEQALTSDGLYEDLIHNDAFMDYWNTFENANLADKKATNIDEEKFFDELGDYIQEKQTKEFQKKYQNLKTVKGKSGAIDKWVEAVAELKDILMKHRKTLENMVKALNLAADIKMLLWAGFKDTHTDYDTFYKSRTKGFFKADMEGIAMSDADGNIVKIVDRSAFSSYNRDPDIMSGWEHPENSKAVKESSENIKRNLKTLFETKSFKKLDEEKLWNAFSELLEDDESQKSVVIGWGRMNPPTIGHLKLINKMKDLAMDTQCPARLFLSHTVDKKNERKNPLPYESKIKYATIAFGELVDVVNTDSKTIMAVLHDLYAEGFTRLVYVGGEDRIGGGGDITELISKYNGYPAKENMYYKFETIVFESAGHRDENSEDKAEKASASYVRQLVIDHNWEEFKEMVPFTTDKAKQLFDELTTAMKVEPVTEKVSNPRVKTRLKEDVENALPREEVLKVRNLVHDYLIDFLQNDEELSMQIDIDAGYQGRHPLEAARIRPAVTATATTEDFLKKTGIFGGIELSDGSTAQSAEKPDKHGGEASSDTFASYEVTVTKDGKVGKVYIADASKYKKIYTPNKVLDLKASDYEGKEEDIETESGVEKLQVTGKELEYRSIAEEIKKSLLTSKNGKESKEGGTSKNILPSLIEAQYDATIPQEDQLVVKYLTGMETPTGSAIKSNFTINTPANAEIQKAIAEVEKLHPGVVKKLERSLLVDFAEIYGAVALSAAVNKVTGDKNMYITYPVASNEPLLDYSISNVPTKGTGLGYRISAKTNMGGKPSTTGVVESIVKFLKSKGNSPMAGGKTVIQAYARGASLVDWLNKNVSASSINTHEGFQALENLMYGGSKGAVWMKGIKFSDLSEIKTFRLDRSGSNALKLAGDARQLVVDTLLNEYGIKKTIGALDKKTFEAAVKDGRAADAYSSYITKIVSTAAIAIINADEKLISEFNALFNLSFGTFVQLYLDEKGSDFYKGSFKFNAVVKSIDGQTLSIGKDAPRYEFHMNTGLASKDYKLSNQKLAVTLVH